MSGPGRSTMSAIDRAEEEIKSCYYRLEVLEKNLKYRAMTNDEREHAEKDVLELRKILKHQESQLQLLQKENRSLALIAVVCIIISFLIFGLYHMYLNAYKPDPPLVFDEHNEQ